MPGMVDLQSLEHLDVNQLRALAAKLMDGVKDRDRELHRRQTKIDQLTHEIAGLKRWKFAARSEQLNPAQKSLLDETIDADLAAIEVELEQLSSKPKEEKQKPRRAPLPAHLPRVEIQHEPDSANCRCGCALKRIGEDIAEKLDYTPGVFMVERHIRGRWACARCETIVQAPVPPHVIDKGIPTAGLLAQVMVAKFSDHLPLYRQEAIFERAGVTVPRSTMAQWVGACGVQLQPLVDALKAEILEHPVLHADETPVAMLSPGKHRTHRSYLWTYCPGAFESLKAVVYDFADNRSGKNALDFLGLPAESGWRGKLVCDDFSGYKALFDLGVTEIGCMAHVRRKWYDLHAANQSQIAQEALQRIAQLYAIEGEVKDLPPDQRLEVRRQRARPAIDSLHAWLALQRQRVSDGSATAKAIDYALRRWDALCRYLDDPQLPIDNNWAENRIRPVALGRGNWLFAGSLRAGKRAAAVMSLIQSAKMNQVEPWAYLKDILTRLPTHPANAIGELLPHRWKPAT
jgi:transposase